MPFLDENPDDAFDLGPFFGFDDSPADSGFFSNTDPIGDTFYGDDDFFVDTGLGDFTIFGPDDPFLQTQEGGIFGGWEQNDGVGYGVVDDPFGDFSKTLFGLAGNVLPIWTASQVDNQQRDQLFNPLYNPAFAKPSVNPVKSTSSFQKAGFLTGSTLGDGLIIGGIALVALILVMKK